MSAAVRCLLGRTRTNGPGVVRVTSRDTLVTDPDGRIVAARFYGGGGTIHGTEHLNIETDPEGRIVAVWFRCQMLPFERHVVTERRAAEMVAAGADDPNRLQRLLGVTVADR